VLLVVTLRNIITSSVAIELIQRLVPARSADIDDVIVNVLGAVLGYATLIAGRAVAKVQSNG
jgi:glycopeptide antibiotics resistance protein